MILLLAAAPLHAQRAARNTAQTHHARTVPTETAETLRAQRALSQTVEAFHAPPGFAATLFAAEPMVRNPTSVVVDSRGRVWITEGRNYRLWRTEKKGQIERKPEGDQIKILEDTDGDGRADRVTLFAQGIFPAPMGLAVEEIWNDGNYSGCRVYVGNSPQLLLLEDTDGDDRADRREPLLKGFRGVDSDHGLHGLALALDGRLYFTVGDARYGVNNVQAETPTFDVTDRSGRRLRSARYGTVCRVRPDGTQMEVLAHRLRNDYETCVDSFGNVFVSDNDDDGHFGCRINWILTGGNYGYRLPGTRLHSAEDLPGVVPKIAGTGNGSPAGLLVYEGTMLPPPFRNAILEADAGTRQINAFPLVRFGAAYRTRYEVLLKGDDDWFRPVDLDVAPDGSLFIADWYDAGVGGNRVSDQTTGRIYRVARAGARYATPTWNRRSLHEAAAAIHSPNRTTQFAARRILLGAAPRDAIKALAGALRSDVPAERARALGVLHAIPEGEAVLVQALRDRSPAVRTAVLRLLAQDATRDALVLPPKKSPPTPPIMRHWDACRVLARDPDPGVRCELLLALRHVPTAKSADLLQQLAISWDGRDRYYLEALRCALRDREPEFLTSLFSQFAARAASHEIPPHPTIAIPPYFPTSDNTAFLPPDRPLPPATPVSQLAGLAWALGRNEALPALRASYAKTLHPDEREAIERALIQLPARDAARLLVDRWRSGDDPVEQRRLLGILSRAAQTSWGFLRTDRDFLQSLEKMLGRPPLQSDAFAAIRTLRLASFQHRLLEFATDAARPAQERGAALAVLVHLGSRPAIELARKWLDRDLTTPDDMVLGLAAVRALSGDAASNRLLTRIASHPGAPLELRRAALGELLQRPASARRIMKRIQDGKLDEPLAKEAALQLANHSQRQLRDEARRRLAAKYGLAQRLIDFDTVLALTGDPSQGETVFFTRGATPCGKCHQAAGIGAAIGPDLSTIGTKYGKRELLSHIVFPNQAINYNYAASSLMLRDGRVLGGMIVQRSTDSLTLATPEGNIIHIDARAVEEEKTQPNSLMPEGLCNALTDQEIADLVAFLSTLCKPVVQLGEALLAGPIPADSGAKLRWKADKKPARIQAGQGGRFSLPPIESNKEAWRLAWRLRTSHAQRVRLVVDLSGDSGTRKAPGDGEAKKENKENEIVAWLDGKPIRWEEHSRGTRHARRSVLLLPRGATTLVVGVRPSGRAKGTVRVTLIPTRSLDVSAEVGPDESAAAPAKGPDRFRSGVLPLLAKRCLGCHAGDRKGGLDLRRRETVLAGGESGPAATPGKPDESLIWEMIDGEEMPPDKPLPPGEQQILKAWIAEGLYYPPGGIDLFALTTDARAGYDWWSFQPLKRTSPPRVDKLPPAWRASPIDRFIGRRLLSEGLGPSPPATPRSLIRRVTYDLTGLPPSPREIHSFLEACRRETGEEDRVSDAAYRALVDRLLASSAYGEHWGRHWLDVVRFGESRGYERNEIIRNLWPFRDYVIRRFNEDAPLDQLIREHLAGDVLGKHDPHVEIGTAFLVCGPYDDVGNQDPAQAAQIRANTIDEIIRATGEAFLGLTIGCGRCHDHKFDPISQRDYYAWYATFAGVRHGSREVATEADRSRRQTRIEPLQRKIASLKERERKLEKDVLGRAEQEKATYESAWRRAPIDRRGTEERFEPVEVRAVRLVVLGTERNPAARAGFTIDEFEVWSAGASPVNVALAANGGKAEGASRRAEDFAEAYTASLTVDGEFGARWLSAGPTLTIRLARPTTIDRIVFSSDRTGAAGNHPVAAFVSEYRIEVSADGRSWQTVADSQDRKPISPAHRRHRLLEAAMTPEERQQLAAWRKERQAAEAKLRAVPPLPNWWVGTFEPVPGKTHVFVGGNPQRKGDEVVPSSIKALDSLVDPFRLPADAPESDRRLALARWLTNSNNALVLRVLANRVWHYHFGRGIVDTPSDFGFMGGRPSHPELLDYLARRLLEAGWRWKPLHREIVLSRTYRQASVYRAKAAEKDGGSRLLWRFPPRRLTGEEIRDTMLAVAGKLDRRMGGPGFRLYRYLQDNVATYIPLDRWGPETYRRAVYHHFARAARVDYLTDFDCPDNSFPAPRRATTTSPLQALTMLNHSFTQDMARALAERLRNECGTDIDAQVARAYELLYGRPPDGEERAWGVEFIRGHSLRAFARALFNTNEFVYID